MKAFVSYVREDDELARGLAADLEALGHEVWLDQKLKGGQDWWDEILERLRSCDLHVYVLSPRAIGSGACTAELEYSNALRRPRLPVMVRKTSPNVLPEALAKVQQVDYTLPDKKAAALRLAAALGAISPQTPLPDPLPSPPVLPVAPLHEVRVKVESAQLLGRPDQLDLYDRLDRAAGIDELREDAVDLLRKLRGRDDILGPIRDRIDAKLSHIPGAEEPGDQERPGSKTFRALYNAGVPESSGLWKLFRRHATEMGSLIVEPRRLEFRGKGEPIVITDVTRVSLQTIDTKATETWLVVERRSGENAAFSTWFTDKKLMEAIQHAFELT